MDSAPQFGVSTRNAFDLLDDDAPIVKKQPKAAPPPAKKAPPKKEPRKRDEDWRGDGGDAPRDRDSGRGGRGRGGKGGGRGRGKGKGGNPRQREFDRHVSGTGRDRAPKKEGHGKSNWGTHEDEFADATKAVEAPKDDEPKAEDGEADKEKATEKPAEEEEEKDNTISYEEYLKQKEANRVAEDVQKRVRKVQNDDSQFAAVPFRKDEDDDFQIELGKPEKENQARKNTKAKGGGPKKVNIDEFVSKGGSGGRGKGKGRVRGRGRGGSRAPAYDDANFPKLG